MVRVLFLLSSVRRKLDMLLSNLVGNIISLFLLDFPSFQILINPSHQTPFTTTKDLTSLSIVEVKEECSTEAILVFAMMLSHCILLDQMVFNLCLLVSK